MEETTALDEGAVHLLPPELGVRPRLACKAEGAVPRGIQGDKGQSGEGGGGEADAPGLDSSPAQGLQKEAAEGILSHLAQKGGAPAISAQGGQKIARRAPGIGLERGMARPIGGHGGKINEQLAQGHNVIDSFLTHKNTSTAAVGPSAGIVFPLYPRVRRKSRKSGGAHDAPLKNAHGSCGGGTEMGIAPLDFHNLY